MTIRSLRTEAEIRLGDQLDWANGWRGGVWNPYWRAHPEDYPFRDIDGKLSLRAFMDNLRWPIFSRLEDSPKHEWTAYSDNVQGIAPYVSSTGALYWVLARKSDWWRSDGKGFITIIDASDSLDSATPIFDHLFENTTPSAGDYDHFGDPAVDGDLILIPMEGSTIAPLLLIFKIMENSSGIPTQVTYQGYRELTEQDFGRYEAPWVAVFKNLLFSSFFEGSPSTGGNESSNIFVYHWNASTKTISSTNSPYELYNKDMTPASVWRWQGIDISASGRLFLVSDRTLSGGGGVHMFDLTTGIRLSHLPVSAGTHENELEGIAAFDTSPYQVDPSSEGGLHVCVLHAAAWGLAPDKISIYHWKPVFSEAGDEL